MDKEVRIIKGPIAHGVKDSVLTETLRQPMTFNIIVNGIGIYTPDSFPNGEPNISYNDTETEEYTSEDIMAP